MKQRFYIQGHRKLSGSYRVQGNKNAALPILSATLLQRSPVLLRNVPGIEDIENILSIVKALGVKVSREQNTLRVDPAQLGGSELPAPLVQKLRGSILLLGPLATQMDQISSTWPGGCPIGRRSFDVHWSVFQAAGFSVTENTQGFTMKRVRSVKAPRVYLEETSVTATENALLLLSALGGGTIENPAREPHVLSLIDFLRQLGCQIDVHPLFYRVKRGPVATQSQVEYPVPADHIDAGTIAIAAAATGGKVRLEGIRKEELLGICPTLERFGVRFRKLAENSLEVTRKAGSNPPRIVAGSWPSFPTDLMSLAIVLATQGRGLCLMHDWMYEARMFFIDKLVRMGARITMCDPHRVLVEGPSRLRGTPLESPDIRAGMALVVAGLCAEGTTTLEHAEIIARGYESVVERLRLIGAEISLES